MEPDVVEIPPPTTTIASGLRIRKLRKAGLPEEIDVKEHEFRNNVVDKKNKGKAKEQVDSFPYNNVQSHHHESSPLNLETVQEFYDHDNPFSQLDEYLMFQDFLDSKNSQIRVESPSVENPFNVRKIKKEFLRDFKRFDMVEDFSDHNYASKGKSSKQHSKNWVKKVQADWKILANGLPETIFVRACESRMDLLRAVIIGAEGTPYHDGLFFFDIHFPDTYPLVPPKVHYHSGGLRINPNLYDCGKVCLSLLGTWAGSTWEQWLPKESTVLQLLVSIQALILNQKPYFNEPLYAWSEGTSLGEFYAKVYSEKVFILSLRTMVYTMRRPLKHFEEFVRCHFYVWAHDIVKACNAYIEGAPLGSIVKGVVQDVEETSQSGSYKFKTDVASFMETVVDEFVKLGVKELPQQPKLSRLSGIGLMKEYFADVGIGRCVCL